MKVKSRITNINMTIVNPRVTINVVDEGNPKKETPLINKLVVITWFIKGLLFLVEIF